MRIGLDARYAYRHNRRGIGEYVASLIQCLPNVSNLNDQFIMYVDRQAELRALEVDDPRFVIRRLPVANPLLWEEFALPRAAAGDQIELLHLTSNYGPSRSPCPTIYTIHDAIEFVRASFGAPNLSWRHAFGRNIRVRTLPHQARRAHGIITVSQASQRDLVRLFGLPAERIHVIPLGVSDVFRPSSDANGSQGRSEAPRAKPYVLALGALDPRKNGGTLIRAFANSHEVVPDYDLRIVGIERPEEYPVPINPHPKWLHLSGFVPRSELVSLMQAATVFVYPSLYEGFGLPPVEAMACGVPVLVSDHPAVLEVVGEAGISFQGTSVSDLSEKLSLLLLDSALRQELARLGIVHAARFSWMETVRRTYDAYLAANALARGSAA